MTDFAGLLELLDDDELRRAPGWVDSWRRSGAMDVTAAAEWERQIRKLLMYRDLTDDSSPVGS